MDFNRDELRRSLRDLDREHRESESAQRDLTDAMLEATPEGERGLLFLPNLDRRNFLRVGGIALAIGVLVDAAIVMVENIARYLEAGDSPLAAALKGSAEIGFTIISLTFSLIAVFIAVPLGTLSAVYRDTWIDNLIRVIAVSGLAIPGFWLGMIMTQQMQHSMGKQ